MIRSVFIVPMLLACAPASAAAPKAQALWDAGDYRHAFAEAFEAANAGDAQAQFLLGEAYRLGRSVDADILQARDWYMRAARLGDVGSAAALGELLLKMGRSSEAIPWLTLAASHNHAHATALLAAIYFTGDGAEKDLILATSLMKKAAAEGSPEARAKLALMDDTASPVDVSSPAPITAAASQALALPPRALVPVLRSGMPIEPATASATPARVSMKYTQRAHEVGMQVGAFRSATNARRALQFVAARLSGTTYRTAIVQSHGFYKVLLNLDGPQSARYANTRLVRVRWQHFFRRQAFVRI